MSDDLIKEIENRREWRVIASRLELARLECNNLQNRDTYLQYRNQEIRTRLERSLISKNTDVCSVGKRLFACLQSLSPGRIADRPIDTPDKCLILKKAIEDISEEVSNGSSERLKAAIHHDIEGIRRLLEAEHELKRHLHAIRTSLTRCEPPPGPDDLSRLITLAETSPIDIDEADRLLSGDHLARWRACSEVALNWMIKNRLVIAQETVETLVIVENDDSWQQRIASLVVEPLRSEYSGLAGYRAGSSIMSTRLRVTKNSSYIHYFKSRESVIDWLSQQSAEACQRTIALCDLQIPPNDHDYDSESIDCGISVIEAFAAKGCPTIVLTTHGVLFDAFVRLGHIAQDFIEKGGHEDDPDQWARATLSRLKAYIAPLRVDECSLEVLAFTGTTIVFNGVEVRLPPLEFALIESLVSGSKGALGALRPCLSSNNTMMALKYLSERGPANSIALLKRDAEAKQEVSNDEYIIWRREGKAQEIRIPKSTLVEVRKLLTGLPPREVMQRIKYLLSGRPSLRHTPHWQELAAHVSLSGFETHLKLPENVEAYLSDHLNRAQKKIATTLKQAGKRIPGMDGRNLEFSLYRMHPDGTFELKTCPERSVVIRSPYSYLERRQKNRSGDSFNILIVEDDHAYLAATHRALVDACIGSVDTASDEASAIEKLQDSEYQLVVLDLELPERTPQSPSLRKGMNLRRVISKLDNPPQVIIFSIHDSSNVRAGLERLAAMQIRGRSRNLLADLTRAFVPKTGLLDRDTTIMAIEAKRAYVDYRRGYYPEDQTDQQTTTHNLLIGKRCRDGSYANEFTVDGKRVPVLARSEPEKVAAAGLLYVVGLYDNLLIHRQTLARELVMRAIFETANNLNQRLTRLWTELRGSMRKQGFDNAVIDEIFQRSRDGDAYCLRGIVTWVER